MQLNWEHENTGKISVTNNDREGERIRKTLNKETKQRKKEQVRAQENMLNNGDPKTAKTKQKYVMVIRLSGVQFDL